MALANGMEVIALEEHYYDPDVTAQFTGVDAKIGDHIRHLLEDLSEQRVASMDEAGIDFQVLSHGAPSTQRMKGNTAISVAKGANDKLGAFIKSKPDRFGAFAALPTDDPIAAADELARAVNELGMVGAMIHGPSNGVFIDDKRFWPIFERAAALDVPIYLHPAAPHPAVVEAYYKDYVKDFPGILTAAWGFTAETATQGIRMVLSGVFDAYPDLKIVLGHLGETLPFLVWRISQGLSRPPNKPLDFRDVFCSHFYVTTSGFFSDPALHCCLLEMGVDRVLFSVDYPFVANKPGTDWMESTMLNAEDKRKILSGNAKRLLKL